MHRRNMYNYNMCVNEKFGCLLYSTDLNSIYDEEQQRRMVGRTGHRHNHKHNKSRVKCANRVVKPVDFFLYNEILMSNALSENDDIYNDTTRFETHLYSFSSFVPLKSKKEMRVKEEITRSENDDPANEITYGAFNYSFKDKTLMAYLSESRTRTGLCSRLITTYKKTLDNLAYLKKNEAVHLGISLDMILVRENGSTLLDGARYMQFAKELKEFTVKTTICDKDNGISPLFIPIELSLLMYMFKNDLQAVSPNNVRAVISEHMFRSEIMKRLPEAFQTEFITNCEAVLCKYVNVPKRDVANDVINQSGTWGVYSVSIAFLSVLMKIQPFCSNLLKTGIFNKWFKLLLMNTHPNPNRRKTVEENMTVFSKLTCVKSFAEFAPFLSEVSDENLLKICAILGAKSASIERTV